MRGAVALVVLAVALMGEQASAGEPIAWDDAEHHVGEEATVEGRVLGIHCSPLSCLLAFDPTFNRFTAVIQAANFDKLPPNELEDRYSGKRIRVTGKIESRDGKPEIQVDKPEAIALIEEKEPAEEPQAATSRAQVELLERLGDVLARIEELTDRLAATQERIDGLLVDMEQREAALAAALASQAPPPAPLPARRPAFEALRSIKRGMLPAEVQRLLGQPDYVDSGTGWTVWYYGPGRSITFDQRGRVSAMAGFGQ